MEGTNKNMDSVFDQAMQDEAEFDVMFDQEDDMIDTINGVNENGDPLTGVDFVELHQDHHDDVSAKDIKDGEGKDAPMGAKDPEGTDPVKPDDTSVAGEIGKKSDADKFTADADDKYQNGKEGNVKPDENDITGTIDKVTEGQEDLDSFMMDDDDDEGIEEGCKKEGEDCDGECCGEDGVEESVDSIEDEIEKEKNAPVEESGEIDSDVNKVDNADFDGEDDIVEAAEKNQKEKESMSQKYSYDLSDEELIDMAMNN